MLRFTCQLVIIEDIQMLITMLKSCRGCYDGFLTKVYEKRHEYDLPDTLAKYFLRSGAAYNSELEPELPASPSAFETCMYELSMASREFDKMFRKSNI